MRNTLVPCALALLAASCGGGGGGGGNPPVSRIDGTAAIGSPLANAAVEVKCAAGSGQGNADADGRFSIAISGAQAPCLLKAEGGGTTLVSATPASGGTANVTSLTHLMAARLLGASPAQAYAAAGADAFARITAQGVSAAQGGVTEELLRIGAQMPSVDWVASPFTARPGDALDGALELLHTKLAAQNKTLDGAATELAAGPLLDVTPPGEITCVPGMIAGFDRPLQDQLTRVISQPDIGGGDGPGGVGAGDGGSDGAADGVGVGGSLGQFVNVDVTVEFASGMRFGPTRVDAATGMVTLVPCNLQPPALVTFTGAPGSGATYFDEELGNPASFEGATIRGILTRLDRNGGVTPFTEAMVRRTLALGAQVATDGGVRLKAIEKAEDAWKDPSRVQAAHDEVLRAVNDLLPGIYRLEDLRRLPVVVGQAGGQPDSGALTDNQNGVYGAVLGGLAKAAARSQPTSAAPALAIQRQIADDLEDGVLNLRRDASPVSPDIGGGTYQYDTFAARLTNETGAVAKALGAGNLKTAVVPVQRMKARVGTDFEATPNWIFTLRSDGTLQIVRDGGAAADPPNPAGLRFSRIDLFDRSTRTIPGSEELWQNCLVATAMDGQTLYTWRVGMSGGFQTRDVGAPGDPVVGILPESLSAEIQGGDSILFVRRSGETGTTAGCDVQDFHPGLAQGAAGHYVVQAFQDFGNRYLVYSDGTVQAWGIDRGALGVGETGDDSLGPEDKKFVLPEAGGGAELTGVAMLARGQDIQQTRALLRTPEATRNGRVVVWGRGLLSAPRVIPGLEDICWIAGPYAVACNGQLLHAEVTGVAGGGVTAVVTPVTGAPPIWRVNADLPVDRSTVNPSGDPEDEQVTSLVLGHTAIARDGRIYELNGIAATEVAQ